GGQLPPGITMFSCNTSTSGHSTFLLTGFPGLGASHHWVSIPINLICVVSVLGKGIILFLIRTDPALHEPMYIFLSTLAASDLGLCASTFPTMVQLFWLGVSMAKVGPAILVNSLVGLVSILLSLGSDSSLIILSYALILRTVLSIASPGKRLKALNMCVSHLCIVLIFYLPKLGLSELHRVEKHSYPALAVLTANLRFLVPPFMNPIVYCTKSKQIHQGLLKRFQQKRVDVS
ncbi:hypothetical protein E2I00_003555, partial [Balaenoptera physalus]